MLTSALQIKVDEYQQWRNSLTKAIADYRDWLAKSEFSDAVQELRLYDILDTLHRDQIVVAFLAEFSRGKTETINALFFADFNQRLLPSAAGRTTMCPTEIFWDDSTEPYIALLPIESRASDDSITYLKNTPNAWQKFRLNTHSSEALKEAFSKLIAQKEVTQAEAIALGLWDAQDLSTKNASKMQSMVSIPAWRHAMISYPHPLLKSGLVVIDTPGLNTIGAEPELTFNIIPNAHAVLFLTATDTGMTQSDMRIWNELVKRRASYKFVVLNKIDMLWDNLKSQQEITQEIEKQVHLTAQQLGISTANVFAISAQKGLVAKIHHNDELLKQSGLVALETMLGDQTIQTKHAILGKTIAAECGEMIKRSRKILQQNISHQRAQVLELRALKSKSADATKGLLAKIVADRKRYEASIPTFNLANDKITRTAKKLLSQLSLPHLSILLDNSRKEMGDSWTTVGLNNAIRSLMKQTNDLAAAIQQQSDEIKQLADNIYQVFQKKHGFTLFEPPRLDMSAFVDDMYSLEKVTNDFCADPLNMLTEKHFLIRKFFLSLGAETQRIFTDAEKNCVRWVDDILSVLKTQMSMHKNNLDKRSKNLMDVKSGTEALNERMALLENAYAQAMSQGAALDKMLLQIVRAAKPVTNA